MKKILIVDDDQAILSMLSKALLGTGVEIMTATKIEEAEYAIKHAHLNLVIADLRLTGMLGEEGLELLDYVKEKSPDTKVIIITGYGSAEVRDKAYERGALHYFEKPVDILMLRNKIGEIGLAPTPRTGAANG